VLGLLADECGEVVPALVLARVQRAVEHLLQEHVELRRRAHADQRLAQLGAVAGVVQRLAGDADDAAAGRDLAIEETVEQRRQQFAHGKVAGAAEDHQVERFDRLGGSSHAITSTRCRMAGRAGRWRACPGCA